MRDAIAAGATPKRLRGTDLTAPFHGIRTVGQTGLIDAYALLLRPDDRFSHLTAARLWGAPVPADRADELHVSATRGVRPRSTGCVGHLLPGRCVMRRGLPVSDPAQLLIECATLLPIDDLVAIADHLVLSPRILDPLDPRPYATLDELTARLLTSRAQGVRLARKTLVLARPGVESPMETRLRLLLGRAKLPEPLCGFELRLPNGSVLGWFDLAWPERRVIAEYDGDQHRTSTGQYEKDIQRFDEAAAIGWRVIRVRSHGIFGNPARTVAAVRDALSAGMRLKSPQTAHSEGDSRLERAGKRR